MTILELVPDLLDKLVETGRPWIESYGLWAVLAGLMLETVVFAGLIIPGYGILVAAGYMAAAGLLLSEGIAASKSRTARGQIRRQIPSMGRLCPARPTRCRFQLH